MYVQVTSQLYHACLYLYTIIFRDMFNFIRRMKLYCFLFEQAGCDFMALPIVTIMVPVLAAGFLVHIIYAFILTAGNIKARGGIKRYEGGSKGKAESWASKNMLVLGIVVLGPPSPVRA